MIGNIFYKNYPYIDLHGYDTESARVAVNDFINDNLLLNNHTILIIHGKGTGAVKKSVHETLSKNKQVSSYSQDTFNEGVTIVHLFLD